jgi:hypothetical protein
MRTVIGFVLRNKIPVVGGSSASYSAHSNSQVVILFADCGDNDH